MRNLWRFAIAGLVVIIAGCGSDPEVSRLTPGSKARTYTDDGTDLFLHSEPGQMVPDGTVVAVVSDDGDKTDRKRKVKVVVPGNKITDTLVKGPYKDVVEPMARFRLRPVK